MKSESYLPRLADRTIADLLSALPAVMVIGARATGKSTTAARFARTIVRLDRPQEAAAWEASPDAMLARAEEPVLIDEWQLVPAVLGAIKRAVDADPHPGRFLVTGSVRSALESPTWPGTGRVVQVPMHGLCERELRGRTEAMGLLDRIFVEGLSAVDTEPTSTTLPDYIDVALRGGFPEVALRLPQRYRRAWLSSYLSHALSRDAEQIDPGRDPARLRRYAEAVAVNNAGVVDQKTLWQSAGLSPRTADIYERLLENLGIIDRVPPWWTNRLKRLGKAPKHYVADPALALAILGLNADSVLKDGGVLGRTLDALVAMQVRAEIAHGLHPARLHHLRQQDGRHEVDLLVEYGGGRVLGIEVKASATVTRRDGQHLAWLRDEVGEDRFVGGLVLHTGQHVFDLGPRVVAAPISCLWS